MRRVLIKIMNNGKKLIIMNNKKLKKIKLQMNKVKVKNLKKSS